MDLYCALSDISLEILPFVCLRGAADGWRGMQRDQLQAQRLAGFILPARLAESRPGTTAGSPASRRGTALDSSGARDAPS